MSTLILAPHARRGLRPVHMRHDLAQIADLIELCFAEAMDRSGRAAIEEMRIMSRLGAGLWVLQGLDTFLKGMMQGFVWIEDGRVVGNISIYPSGTAYTWVIANVAVHPDYRKQGIAQQMCQAALNRIAEWDGRAAILQVDHDNEGAQRLYLRLGFRIERTFTRWLWNSTNRTPKLLPDAPPISQRTLSEWQAEYALAKLVRPPERGGMGWLKPLDEKRFRMTPLKMLGGFFSAASHEHWVIRGKNKALNALLLSNVSFGSSTVQFDMLVHPQRQGQLEDPLLNFILRHATDQFRGASTDHPTDDEAASEAFRKYGFTVKRTLIHMRWER